MAMLGLGHMEDDSDLGSNDERIASLGLSSATRHQSLTPPSVAHKLCDDQDDKISKIR
jgi:hypothetical protein